METPTKILINTAGVANKSKSAKKMRRQTKESVDQIVA